MWQDREWIQQVATKSETWTRHHQIMGPTMCSPLGQAASSSKNRMDVPNKREGIRIHVNLQDDSPILEISLSCSLSESMFEHKESTIVSTWCSLTLLTRGPRLKRENPNTVMRACCTSYTHILLKFQLLNPIVGTSYILYIQVKCTCTGTIHLPCTRHLSRVI